MSVASTVAPRAAAAYVCPPAPAATSRTREPSPTFVRSSIRSVAAPSHSSSVGPHRCHGSAASCHCSRVVSLYRAGSNTPVAILDLLDPAEQVVARDLVEQLGMVGPHVRACAFDDFVVRLSADDRAALARDLLRHAVLLGRCRGSLYASELGAMLARTWRRRKCSSAGASPSSSTAAASTASCRGDRGACCSRTSR